MIIKPYCWKWRYPRNWLKNIEELFLWCKWFIQRGLRGYADNDVWEIDISLLNIVIPMLKDLKENSRGYPGNDDCPTFEKWQEIIQQMINGFEAAKRVSDDEYYLDTGYPEVRFKGDTEQWTEDCLFDQKIFEDMMPIFTKYFFSLWD